MEAALSWVPIHKETSMQRLVRSSLAALLALGFLASSAWAGVSREDATSIAQRKAPGRVLVVEQGVDLENKVVWRVRMLTAAGDLRVVVIDANTGQFR